MLRLKARLRLARRKIRKLDNLPSTLSSEAAIEAERNKIRYMQQSELFGGMRKEKKKD